jgi:hypothetical protein
MTTLTDAAQDFLAQKRIAVVGVSRRGNQPANFIFRKLRGAGCEVFPVNPNAKQVEGVACHPNLKSIPGGVDGVVVATHPRVTADIVRECAEIGISRIWLHRSFGQGSVSDEALHIAREHRMTVIPGGCPMMFCRPVDLPHKCMRWAMKLVGRLPTEV